MFSNILILIVAASVLADNAKAVDESSTKLPSVQGFEAVNNTKQENENINATNIELDNINANNTTTEKNVDIDNTVNTTKKNSTGINTESNVNHTTETGLKNTTNENIAGSETGITGTTGSTVNINGTDNNNTLSNTTIDANSDSNAVRNNENSTVNINAPENKPVNNTADQQGQGNTTAIPPALHESDAAKNDKKKENTTLSGTASSANGTDTGAGQPPKTTTHINQYTIQEIASTTNGKWKAILITSVVVIVGCCGVVLVRRTLKSERGQAWMNRTRRQANVPCRDYEVQYLVIRDSDD